MFIADHNFIKVIPSLVSYELSDDQDDMANYLVLSLQTDEVAPTPMKMMDETLVEKMEKRILDIMMKFGLSRLELFRKIAVKCKNFIVFIRESSFGSDPSKWPASCGEIFNTVPIFTPFGTCFTSMTSLK